MVRKKQSTLNQSEVDKFSAIADEWWDETGKFRPLHKMNPLRIGYIKDKFGDLKGKRILDVGCGGGLLSVPLARLGGDVTAIDASDENIKVAQNYAERIGLEIDYQATLIEDFAPKHKKQFDLVTALEIIEHVDNLDQFLNNCIDCLKPGGILIISTINRTLKSLALAKIGAEYILRWVPAGTHEWGKFVKPNEIEEIIGLRMKCLDTSGMVFSPISNDWRLSRRTNVNYIMTLKNK